LSASRAFKDAVKHSDWLQDRYVEAQPKQRALKTSGTSEAL